MFIIIYSQQTQTLHYLMSISVDVDFEIISHTYAPANLCEVFIFGITPRPLRRNVSSIRFLDHRPSGRQNQRAHRHTYLVCESIIFCSRVCH